jgi:hypothetical protein
MNFILFTSSACSGPVPSYKEEEMTESQVNIIVCSMPYCTVQVKGATVIHTVNLKGLLSHEIRVGILKLGES